MPQSASHQDATEVRETLELATCWNFYQTHHRSAWIIGAPRLAEVNHIGQMASLARRINSLTIEKQRKPTRRQDQTGAGARTGGTAGVHQQADSERSELFADAKWRIDRNHVDGQRPNNGPSHPWSGAAPGAYSMSGVVGHRVHGENPTQNAHGTSDKLMLVVDNGCGMAHHADAIGSDGRQYATEG